MTSFWRNIKFLVAVLITVAFYFQDCHAAEGMATEEMAHALEENSSAIHPCGAEEEPFNYFPIARWQWHEVDIPVIIGIWILFASLVRIVFTFTPLEKYIPESCVLITVGLVIGLVAFLLPSTSGDDTGYLKVLKLDSTLFFLYLLPPIMLEAGYFMPVRAFTNNLATILLFAVIGTLFNAVTVGLSLYAVSEFGWLGRDKDNIAVKVSFLECFTFSSLISAVDPVAVLAVFEEIHVNQVLYILVFGESLLNDAVTVVLYRMFETFNEIELTTTIKARDVIYGFLSFFVVSIGGVFVGTIFGFLTALITRFTHHVRVIEPVFIFIMSYLAYLIAEMLSLSSILSIVACAMVMKPYVERNISHKSHTTVKYSMKMLSSLSETIIFIFLGTSVLTERDEHHWNTGFVFFTLIFTFIYRFIGVIWQCYLANRYRLIKINSKEKFIMGYGGIRGAIAFSLAAVLCVDIVPSKKIFFTTTIVVVMFTIFVQGMTIKPLVNKLHVKKEEKHKPSMNEEIFSRVNDHILAGLELILGHEGRNTLRQQWRHVDNKYVKKLLIKDYKPVSDPKILDVYQKLTQKDAQDYIQQHGTFNISPSVSNFLRTELGSGMMGQSQSCASFSQLPVNEGLPCLDMHATDTNTIPVREQKDSVFHHTDLLAKSMYKSRPHAPTSKISVQDNPKPLMYRSIEIQLKHKMKRRKHKRSKPTLQYNKKGSGAQLLAPPAITVHPAGNSDSNHNSPENHLSPEEDQGIVFFANPISEDDIDGRKLEDVPKLSIQESSVPWRLSQMDVEVSARASQDPHDELGNQVPLSPQLSVTETPGEEQETVLMQNDPPEEVGDKQEDVGDEPDGDKMKPEVKINIEEENEEDEEEQTGDGVNEEEKTTKNL